MDVQQFFVEGLGCASYLVGCEAHHVAAVIDPDRDVAPYVEAAAARGLRITHIIETHLHADHVSGNTDLAARTGASIYLHEAAAAEFPHTALHDGDTIAIGNVRLLVRHTPGHTPDSVTLLAVDTTRAGEPWLAFTGDTLFVGDIGRPDLVGSDAARALAGQMYDSLFGTLLRLDDSLLIFPGHGAGSLCGKSIGPMRSTTLGYERRYNPALAPRTRPEFITFATGELPEQPANHQVIKQANRRGPRVLGDVIPRALSIDEVAAHARRGAVLLDLRPRSEYLTAHLPGSLHLKADRQLSNRVGFMLPPDLPIVLLPQDPQDYRRIVISLARVGYERVLGFMSRGMDAWQARGLPVATGDVQDVAPTDLRDMLERPAPAKTTVLDVREPWEFRGGHIPGARLMPLGELAARVDELDRAQPVAVVCATGSRSQSAAALLAHKGFTHVYNVPGGTDEWARLGYPLET
jgi:glyoxylase-like metal-dependent hydrolase (beta-lactamase superfamily II)/rhodanese-related sulfurtransferase